jgi:hypothetical protein
MYWDSMSSADKTLSLAHATALAEAAAACRAEQNCSRPAVLVAQHDARWAEE